MTFQITKFITQFEKMLQGVYTKFAENVSEQCGVDPKKLEEIWAETVGGFRLSLFKSRTKNSASGNTCQYLLTKGKRFNEAKESGDSPVCGAKCAADGKYCGRHTKIVEKQELRKSEELKKTQCEFISSKGNQCKSRCLEKFCSKHAKIAEKFSAEKFCCVELKSGDNKGKPCGRTIFGEGMCKVHFKSFHKEKPVAQKKKIDKKKDDGKKHSFSACADLKKGTHYHDGYGFVIDKNDRTTIIGKIDLENLDYEVLDLSSSDIEICNLHGWKFIAPPEAPKEEEKKEEKPQEEEEEKPQEEKEEEPQEEEEEKPQEEKEEEPQEEEEEPQEEEEEPQEEEEEPQEEEEEEEEPQEEEEEEEEEEYEEED